MICVILLSGLMPCKTNRFIPTGGVIRASSRLINITTLNQIGSKPNFMIIGYKIGKVIKIMEIDSKIHPKTNSRILIAIKTIHRLVSISATRLVKACGTCRIVKTKPNKAAPIIIAKIIEVVLTVSSKISGISFRPSVR